jgi:hypothetical protein
MWVTYAEIALLLICGVHFVKRWLSLSLYLSPLQNVGDILSFLNEFMKLSYLDLFPSPQHTFILSQFLRQ